MNTDTPRTDAASFSSRDPLDLMKTSQQLERELNESHRAKNLALSRMDDALEKAESLSTPDCHICHNKCQRPLCILSKQLAASRAEVERLTKDITVTEFARARDWINWRYKELDEAMAEVDRLTKKLSITEDELSDAREWLDERYKATSEADERAEKAEAEVESLKTSIKHWEDQCLHFQHAWERSQAMYNKLIYTSTKPIESQEDDK